jgi:hypothetical protein
MPKDFEICIKNKGQMSTKRIDNEHYQHYCKDSNGWHAGEVKKYKKLSRQKKK